MSHVFVFEDNSKEAKMMLSGGVQMRWEPYGQFMGYSSAMCVFFVNVYSGRRVPVPEGITVQEKWGEFIEPEPDNMRFLLRWGSCGYVILQNDDILCCLQRVCGWKCDRPVGFHTRMVS